MKSAQISPNNCCIRGERALVESFSMFLHDRIKRTEIMAEDSALEFDRHVHFLRKKWLALPPNGASPRPMDPDARLNKEKKK